MLIAQDAHDIPSTGYISLTSDTLNKIFAKLRQFQPHPWAQSASRYYNVRRLTPFVKNGANKNQLNK
jgi:hypothetical protein